MEMGSGESDARLMAGAVNEVKVVPVSPTVTKPIFQNNIIRTGTNTSWDNYTSGYTWTYTTNVYLYQIKCPQKTCRKMNWLELDKITPCNNCGSKLKAVSEIADFEVKVKE